MTKTNNTENNYTPEEEWLNRNRSLRMDANKESLFRQRRRDFHLERYQFAAEYCRQKRVLDAACGTGYGSALLAKYASHVSGVDISEEAIDYCRRNYGDPHISFFSSCVEMLPFDDNTFDAVVSFETIEHTIAPRATMMEFVRVLDRQGLGIFSIPNEWGYTKNHFHDFDLPMLNELLQEFFGQYSLFFQNSDDREEYGGKKGIGPLSDIPAQKAECILAVCSSPRKENVISERNKFVMSEMYKNSFERHQQFLSMYHRKTGPFSRFIRRLSRLVRKRRE